MLTGPTKGTLVRHRPEPHLHTHRLQHRADNITFKVTDTAGLTDSGTVGITINAGPALPTQLTASPATVVEPGGCSAFLQNYSTRT